jgi:hypothetical protein
MGVFAAWVMPHGEQTIREFINVMVSAILLDSRKKDLTQARASRDPSAGIPAMMKIIRY